MVYAIIDLGSNSIRLSIFKYDGEKIKLLTNKKVMAGLASYTKNGILTQEGISKACTVLNKFKIIIYFIYKADKLFLALFATASLRNIKNREEVTEQIKIRTGMAPEILAGSEEARLGFVAIKRYYDINDGVTIDIGGGSTELVVFENKKIKYLTSIPIGSLNLQNKYVKNIAATKKEMKKMRKVTRKALEKLDWERKKYAELYAIGGTARAVLDVTKEFFEVPSKERSFTDTNLKHIMKRLCSDDSLEYKAVYKVVPERIFSFCGGIIILNEIVKHFGIQRITISKNGIRDGYFWDKVVHQLTEEKRKAVDETREDFIEDANTSEM